MLVLDKEYGATSSWKIFCELILFNIYEGPFRDIYQWNISPIVHKGTAW